MPPSLGTLLWRALRLRCPVCGQGQLFRGWFAMNERCAICGLRFERAQGYFLGSIFVNYAITAAIVTVTYISLFATTDISPEILLWSLVAFAVLFPLWFFRYARSLWLAIDHYLDPPEN